MNDRHKWPELRQAATERAGEAFRIHRHADTFTLNPGAYQSSGFHHDRDAIRGDWNWVGEDISNAARTEDPGQPAQQMDTVARKPNDEDPWKCGVVVAAAVVWSLLMFFAGAAIGMLLW